MAFDAFLKLTGIKGESQVKGFEDQIQIESFHWGVAQTIVTGGSGGGGATGRPTRKDFLFTAGSSMASPALFSHCVSGKHIQEGLLTLRAAGESPSTFSTIKLTDVLVAAYDQGGDDDGDAPMDEVSLNFRKIDFSYNGESESFDFAAVKA